MFLKKCLAIGLLGVATLPSIAQPTVRHGASSLAIRPDRPAIISNILGAQFDAALPAAKTTSTQQRLIATSGYELGLLQDSVQFFYSTPARGAAHNPKNPASYSTNFWPFGNSGLNADGTTLGRTLYMFPDSLHVFNLGTLRHLSRFEYAADHKVTEVEIDAMSYREKWELTYDAMGDNVRNKRFVDTTFGGPAPVYLMSADQYSTYDGQHRVVIDSVMQPQNGISTPSGRVKWIYNSAGQVASQTTEINTVGMGWIPFTRLIASYLSNGLLQKATYEMWDGSAWNVGGVDSFGYSGNNPSYTYYSGSFYDSDSARLVLNYYMTAHLNGSGNWDTIRSYQYDYDSAVFIHARTVIGYNSYGNWDNTKEYYDIDGNGTIDPTPGYITNYFYDLYTPTSVPEMTVPAGITLAPNPTSGLLKLALSLHIAGARYHLTDPYGRMLHSGDIPNGASQIVVDMGGYAPGMYVMTVMDESGIVLHREKVVRQ